MLCDVAMNNLSLESDVDSEHLVHVGIKNTSEKANTNLMFIFTLTTFRDNYNLKVLKLVFPWH